MRHAVGITCSLHFMPLGASHGVFHLAVVTYALHRYAPAIILKYVFMKLCRCIEFRKFIEVPSAKNFGVIMIFTTRRKFAVTRAFIISRLVCSHIKLPSTKFCNINPRSISIKQRSTSHQCVINSTEQPVSYYVCKQAALSHVAHATTNV